MLHHVCRYHRLAVVIFYITKLPDSLVEAAWAGEWCEIPGQPTLIPESIEGEIGTEDIISADEVRWSSFSTTLASELHYGCPLPCVGGGSFEGLSSVPPHVGGTFSNRSRALQLSSCSGVGQYSSSCVQLDDSLEFSLCEADLVDGRTRASYRIVRWQSLQQCRMIMRPDPTSMYSVTLQSAVILVVFIFIPMMLCPVL